MALLRLHGARHVQLGLRSPRRKVRESQNIIVEKAEEQREEGRQGEAKRQRRGGGQGRIREWGFQMNREKDIVRE